MSKADIIHNTNISLEQSRHCLHCSKMSKAGEPQHERVISFLKKWWLKKTKSKPQRICDGVLVEFQYR